MKFKEGPETVASAQQRLFLNFDRQMEGRTKSIEFWIELVELAQRQRNKELEAIAKQPSLFRFNFTQNTFPRSQADTVDILRHDTIQQGLPTHNTKSQRRVQQNLRQMFLRTQTNVRKRQ